MAANLFQAVVTALSKTALIFDDIPVAAANLIEVQTKTSHPDADPALLPAEKNGKHMGEAEFYLKAAEASLVPKTAIALALGTAAAGLSFVGLSGALTVVLVPLALWICGKSAEKEEDEEENGQKKNHSGYKPSSIDRIMELSPPAKKFLGRLPTGHRRILGQTIKMDLVLEMEMMTLAAVALGASGLATTGIVGLAATVAIMPMVALAATAVVWSAAYGVRKLRHLIGRNQKAIDSGVRQETRLDRILKGIDKKIEPTLGLIGKLALMSIGGQILVELALPLVELIPHVSMVTPAIHSAIHAFESLPGLAQLAVCAPIGYSIGRFAYNPLLAPAASAVKRAAGKVFGSLRFPFKRNQKAPAPEGIKTTTPGPKNDGASGKILKKAPDAKSALNEAAEKQQKSDTLPLPNRLRQNRKNPQNPQKNN